MPKFRPKEILPKAKEWIIKRLTDPGNPYTKPKKPVIELNKAFSVVMDQRMFAEGRIVLKRLRSSTNPHRIRTSGTPPNKKVIKLAESTKPTKAYAKMVRAVNKPKASILESLSKTTGLPSLEKKAAQARELTTKAGSSKKTVQTFTGAVNKTKEAKRLVNETIENPGRAVTKGAEVAIRYPGTTVLGIGGKLSYLSNDPFLLATPWQSIGMGLDALGKRNKTFLKLTEGMADRFHGSKFSNGVEKGVNYAVEFGNNMAKHVIA